MKDAKPYTLWSTVVLPLHQNNCSFYISNYTVPLHFNSPRNNISYLKSGNWEILYTQDSHTPTTSPKIFYNIPQFLFCCFWIIGFVKVQKIDQTKDWTQDLLDIYQML